MANTIINYSIKDKIKNTDDFSYDDLLQDVNSHEKIINKDDMDEFSNDYTVLSIHYKENFVKKELERIAGYYEISKRKKRKDDLVNDIVLFEINIENTYIVERRKELWMYMEEIKSDSYLNKFLVLN